MLKLRNKYRARLNYLIDRFGLGCKAYYAILILRREEKGITK